jgi:hypothetical protein
MKHAQSGPSEALAARVALSSSSAHPMIPDHGSVPCLARLLSRLAAVSIEKLVVLEDNKRSQRWPSMEA